MVTTLASLSTIAPTLAKTLPDNADTELAAAQAADAAAIDAFKAEHFGTTSAGKPGETEQQVVAEFVELVQDRVLNGYPGRGGNPPRYVVLLAKAFILAAERVEPRSTALGSDDLAAIQKRLRFEDSGDSVHVTNPGTGNTASVRGLYEAVHRLLHDGLGRTDTPYGPQQATNAWENNTQLLAHAFNFTTAGRVAAFDAALAFALECFPKNRFFKPAPRVRLFDHLINDYNRQAPANSAERAGTALQAIAFGFAAADRRHLDLAPGKVGRGSKKEKRIGDIDGYRGLVPELAIEVKDLTITPANLDGERQLGHFITAVDQTGIFGIAVVADADDEDTVRQILRDKGIQLMTMADMRRIVSSWDWAKQDVAAQAALHYLAHIEQKESATRRLINFLRQHDPDHESLRLFAAEDAADPT